MLLTNAVLTILLLSQTYPRSTHDKRIAETNPCWRIMGCNYQKTISVDDWR
jgi:hypothetical protein